MTKYLKMWTGRTTGTIAGRDDGYPTTKYIVFNSFEDMLETYGGSPDESYYELVNIRDKVDKEVYGNDEELQLIKQKRKLQLEIDKINSELKLMGNESNE